jgi:hypothetical protein
VQGVRAKKIKISATGVLPDWDDINELTARYWGVSGRSVTRDMRIAMIRHKFTDYDFKLKQLGKDRSNALYEGKEVVKEKATMLAIHLYERSLARKMLRETRLAPHAAQESNISAGYIAPQLKPPKITTNII